MSTPATFNNVVYNIPVQGDLGWGPPLTRFLVALAAGAISPAGGSYSLTADLNLGNSFGLIAAYYKSGGSNIATAGRLRLNNTDLIEWRNFLNNGNNTLGVDTSDNLVYNGGIVPVGLNTLADGKIWIGDASNMPVARTLTGDVTVTNTGVTSISSDVIVNADVNSAAAIVYSKLNLTGSIVNNDVGASASIAYSKLSLTNSIVNADIAAAAAIAYSKLALSNSIVNADINTTAAIDATKIANGSVSSTEFQYLDGVTSSIQTQIDGKQATGNYITALTGDVTATGPGSVAATLATVNSNVGSFGSSTSIPSFTVNGKGLITAASGNVVIAPAGTLTGTVLAANVVTSSLTTVGTIGSGTWNGTTIAVANGGTGDTSLTAYAVLTGGTTSTAPIQSVASVGTSGQVLTSNGAGLLPTFQTATGTGTVNSGTAPLLAYYKTTTNAVSNVDADASMASHKITSLSNGTAAQDAAAFGQIKYLQAVQTTSATQVSTTSSTFTAFTALTVNITPTSASNRVKITVNTIGLSTNVANTALRVTIKRGATELSGVAGGFSRSQTTNSGYTPIVISYIDSPATTSSTTYQAFFNNEDNSTSVTIGRNDTLSTIIVEEIV